MCGIRLFHFSTTPGDLFMREFNSLCIGVESLMTSTKAGWYGSIGSDRMTCKDHIHVTHGGIIGIIYEDPYCIHMFQVVKLPVALTFQLHSNLSNELKFIWE